MNHWQFSGQCDSSFVIIHRRGAAIAQWICLRLPSCRPGFESQVHHLHFFHLMYLCYICHVKRTKINKKRPGLARFFFKKKHATNLLTTILLIEIRSKINQKLMKVIHILDIFYFRYAISQACQCCHTGAVLPSFIQTLTNASGNELTSSCK